MALATAMGTRTHADGIARGKKKLTSIPARITTTTDRKALVSRFFVLSLVSSFIVDNCRTSAFTFGAERGVKCEAWFDALFLAGHAPAQLSLKRWVMEYPLRPIEQKHHFHLLVTIKRICADHNGVRTPETRCTRRFAVERGLNALELGKELLVHGKTLGSLEVNRGDCYLRFVGQMEKATDRVGVVVRPEALMHGRDSVGQHGWSGCLASETTEGTGQKRNY